jgi:hypothetical protein
MFIIVSRQKLSGNLSMTHIGPFFVFLCTPIVDAQAHLLDIQMIAQKRFKQKVADFFVEAIKFNLTGNLLIDRNY